MLKFLAILVHKSDNASVRNLPYNSFNEHKIREGCKPNYKSYPCLWLITWDPTQPVATRPLAIQKDGTWYTYGWDLTKNICEIFGQNGYIRSTYAYTPFGAVTDNGDITQPIQWSSEYYDNELALVYYNYRHYNPTDGRWINRDPIAEQGGWNLYGFEIADYLGLTGDYKPALFDDLEGATDFLQKTVTKELIKIINNDFTKQVDSLLNDISKSISISGKSINTMLIREYGGYLFRSCRNNKYVYKLGKIQIGQTRKITISFEQAPVGYCHIAIWHSHPAGFYSSRIEKKYNTAKEKYEHFIINSTLDGDANKSGLSIDDKAFGFGYVIDKRIKTNNPQPLLFKN